jgi:hypothetical protein
MIRNNLKHAVLLKKRGSLRRKSFRRLFFYIGVIYRLSKGQQIWNKYIRHFYKNYFVFIKQLGFFFKKTLFYRIFMYKFFYSPSVLLSSPSIKNVRFYSSFFYRLTTSNYDLGSLLTPQQTSQIFWIKGWKFINTVMLAPQQAQELSESTDPLSNIFLSRGLWVRSGFVVEPNHNPKSDHFLASFSYEYNLFIFGQYYTSCLQLIFLKIRV